MEECFGTNPEVNLLEVNKTVDKYASEPYNYDIEKAQVKTLSEFKKEFGIEWRELN